MRVTNKNFKMTGGWKIQSKMLQEKFMLLTNTDLKYEETKYKELLKQIQARLDKKREEAINILKNSQIKT